MLGIESGALRKKLLNPPHEKERQETVDALKVVHTSQSDPHFNSIVSLVRLRHQLPAQSQCHLTHRLSKIGHPQCTCSLSRYCDFD